MTTKSGYILLRRWYVTLRVDTWLQSLATSCHEGGTWLYVETGEYKVWLHPVTKMVRDYTYRHATTKSGYILSRRWCVTIRIETWLQSLATSCHEGGTWLYVETRDYKVWLHPVTKNVRDYVWTSGYKCGHALSRINQVTISGKKWQDYVILFYNKKSNHMCGHASLPRCYVTICIDKWLQVWSRPVTKTSRDYFSFF